MPRGEKIPSENDLADIYHVSRITSKKAMKMLAEGEPNHTAPRQGILCSG